MVKAMAVAMDGRHPSGRARAGQGYNSIELSENSPWERAAHAHEVEGDEHKVDGEVTNKLPHYNRTRLREGVDEEAEEEEKRSKQKNMGKTRRAQKAEVK